MRAALCTERGRLLLDLLTDVDLPEMGPNDVVVALGAAGICRSNLSAIDGTLELSLPFVPGHEGSGTVIGVGRAVTTARMGDRVIILSVASCGRCGPCHRRQPHLCSSMLDPMRSRHRFLRHGEPLFGFAGIGTWAERVCVPEESLVVIDDDVPYEVAAIVGCAFATGYGAILNAGRVRPGSSVVVWGCGGVGIAAIMAARVVGASMILGVDPTTNKRVAALSAGATETVAPDEVVTAHERLTGGEGFDCVLDCVGRTESLRAAWDTARRGGTVVVVGIGGRDERLSLDGFELAVDAKTLIGSYYTSGDARAVIAEVLALYRSGEFDLDSMVTLRAPLEAINDTLDAVRSGGLVRALITFDAP